MVYRYSRIPSLDGWRGVAIVLVLLSHVWATDGAPQLDPIFRLPMSQGDLGVRIFFVLSGFLITGLLFKEAYREGNINLQIFYVRRILRIFPVYFLFLATLGALQFSGLYSDDWSSWIGALTFTRNMIGNGRSATGHLWSLAIEEQFYVLWPLAIVIFRLDGRWRVAISLLAIVAAVALIVRTFDCTSNNFVCQRVLGPKSFLRYADSIAIGSIAGVLFTRNSICFPAKTLSATLYAAISLLALSTLIEGPTQPTIQAPLVAAALYASTGAKTTLVYRVLNSAPLVQLGLISYSLYIWHMLFLTHYMGPYFSGRLLYHATIWWLPSILAATISYYGFERRITAFAHTSRYLQPTTQR